MKCNINFLNKVAYHVNNGAKHMNIISHCFPPRYDIKISYNNIYLDVVQKLEQASIAQRWQSQ